MQWDEVILYISLHYKEILSFIWINIKTLLSFFFFCILSGIIGCILFYKAIRNLSLRESIKKCPVVLKMLLNFKYPNLKLYDLKAARMLFVNTFISLFRSNLFWIDERNIQLVNTVYKSEKGIIELTDFKLKSNEIEINYKIESSKDNYNLVKGKNKNNKFIVDDKVFSCYVDTEHNKITINCKGYYIFNQTKLIFLSKICYGENIKIEIDASRFFDLQVQYDVKELIDICNLFCRTCLGLCLVLMMLSSFLLFIGNNTQKVPAILIINIIIFRFVISFVRRLFDIFRETKYRQ